MNETIHAPIFVLLSIAISSLAMIIGIWSFVLNARIRHSIKQIDELLNQRPATAEEVVHSMLNELDDLEISDEEDGS